MKALAGLLVAVVLLVGLGLRQLGQDGPVADAEVSPDAYEPEIDESNRKELAYLNDESIGLSIELFDSVASSYVASPSQTCYRLSAPNPEAVGAELRLEGCWDQSTVVAGQAFLRSRSPGFVFGIAASDVTSVRLATQNVDLRDAGVWYARLADEFAQVDFVHEGGTMSSLSLP